MKLFSKEKGLIFSALNAILLIWMVAAAVSIFSNLAYLIIKEDNYTYEEYSIVYCDEYLNEEDCKRDFAEHNLFVKDWQTTYKRDIIIAVGNIIIVGGVMYLINLEKKKK